MHVLGQAQAEVPKETILCAARAAHEVNRAYCISLGDTTQLPWEQAPDWQLSSAYNGVLGVMRGNTPEQSHISWMQEKIEAGWTYGPVKDADAKTHPCLVPYADLPRDQKAKDTLYVATVRAFLFAHGFLIE